MAEVLIELFSEEIPSRMQKRAAEVLQKEMANYIVENGLSYGDIKTFVTPRRLVLMVDDVPEMSAVKKEERKGPRTDAPQQALDGFLRSTGLKKEQLEIRDDKKGQVYFAVIEREGRATKDIIGEALTQLILNFPWPKSMRWGESEFRWVRPLHSILAIINNGEKVENIPLEIQGVTIGSKTRGHRFMSPEVITVTSISDYIEKLAAHKVILSADERAQEIKRQVETLAFAKGLKLVENQALLIENAGLVEYPVVYIGDIEEAFLSLPAEVLETSMAEHQKFLSLRNPDTNQITGYVVVSNRETADSGATIKEGNAKVLRARLSDALFFWENDNRTVQRDGFTNWVNRLNDVTFHNKIGSQGERVERIIALSSEIASQIDVDQEMAKEAARIAKADLQSEMVYEFPELQGKMGRYYAENIGLDNAISEAIETHYAPLGPNDEVPNGKIAMAVALADKIDLLTGFWSINEKPTGSKDPFALRRAALGVIRIILENEINISLRKIITSSIDNYKGLSIDKEVLIHDIIQFLIDRLTVWMKDQNIRHDVIMASFKGFDEGETDLFVDVEKARAVNDALSSEEGIALQEGVKRAINMLEAEEKKDGVSYELAPERSMMKIDAEVNLDKALDAEDLVSTDVKTRITALAKLREPIDNFFLDVIVNDESAMVRRNRLCILNRVRLVAMSIADFRQLEG